MADNWVWMLILEPLLQFASYNPMDVIPTRADAVL